jgi:hypothetical protein
MECSGLEKGVTYVDVFVAQVFCCRGRSERRLEGADVRWRFLDLGPPNRGAALDSGAAALPPRTTGYYRVLQHCVALVWAGLLNSSGPGGGGSAERRSWLLGAVLVVPVVGPV